MNKSKAENKKTSFSLLLQQNGRFQGVKTLINKKTVDKALIMSIIKMV